MNKSLLNTGFTLVEVLVAMVVSLIIMGGAYSIFNSQQRQTVIQTNISDAQQALRAAMDFMSRDIRMAGYNPTEGKTKFGITSISDTNGMGSITFTWDDPSGTISHRYFLSTLNGSSVAPNSRALIFNGNPLAGFIVAIGFAYAYDIDNDGRLERNSAGNVIWAIDADNDNDWDALNTTTGTTSETGTKVHLDDIRAVRIWILSQAQAPDPHFTDNKTYIVGANAVTPNNHFRHRIMERVVRCRNLGIGL